MKSLNKFRLAHTLFTVITITSVALCVIHSVYWTIPTILVATCGIEILREISLREYLDSRNES